MLAINDYWTSSACHIDVYSKILISKTLKIPYFITKPIYCRLFWLAVYLLIIKWSDLVILLSLHFLMDINKKFKKIMSFNYMKR